MDINDFNEEAYLDRYPDVAAAVASGQIISGHAHFLYCGKTEGRFAPLSDNQKFANKAFFDSATNKIEGWLDEYAAMITMALLNMQSQRNIAGPLIEIGVFKGKYFSVILNEAKKSADKAFGIDNFGFVPEAQVRAILEESMPGHEYTFIAKPSNSMVGDELLAAVGGVKPRFMSIDGSHECEDVIWDLVLAEDICCPEGVISVDDFMNITNVGVNEGVHQFFAQKRKLTPFAFLRNKLFLCRPHMHSLYKNVVESYVEGDKGNPTSELFLHNRGRYRESVEQRLFGQKLLTIW